MDRELLTNLGTYSEVYEYVARVPVGRIILAGVWVFHILYFCFGVKTIKENVDVAEEV